MSFFLSRGAFTGIPGYIFSWLIPNEYTLEHLPVALAHETNHNVRFQFVKWKNDITLGESNNVASTICLPVFFR